MKIKTLKINLNPSYSLTMGISLLKNALLPDYCRDLNKRLVLISDNQLADQLAPFIKQLLDSAGLETALLYFPTGEIYKTRETKQKLEDELLDKRYGRDTCLIALGGGVTSDLVGFLASTYCRGISSIYIPTTLLAMVDASMGGKTGVNTSQGKNLIGTFYQPQAVFMDIDTLKTLPKSEWKNGVVEIIKHSLIADSKLFTQLKMSVDKLYENADVLLDLIYESCRIKKTIIEQDEKELGLRELLNYGHTIGHAIENIENYKISHGEAVAIGLLVEAKLSVEHGFLKENVLNEIENLLIAYHLPLKTNVFKNSEILLNQLKADKKSKAGETYFVLLDEIGHAHIQDNIYSCPVDPNILNHVLSWANQRFREDR